VDALSASKRYSHAGLAFGNFHLKIYSQNPNHQRLSEYFTNQKGIASKFVE
jgi:hypothetical protein